MTNTEKINTATSILDELAAMPYIDNLGLLKLHEIVAEHLKNFSLVVPYTITDIAFYTAKNALQKSSSNIRKTLEIVASCMEDSLTILVDSSEVK